MPKRSLSIRIILFAGLMLVGCSSLTSAEITDLPQADPVPFISILSVDPGISVSFEAGNFPLKTSLTVFIDLVGSEGVDGVVVGTKKTDSTGSIQSQFEIPSEFKNASQLVIRLEGGSGYWAYNTFTNR